MSDDLEVTPRTQRVLHGTAIACAVLTLAGLVALWPRDAVPVSEEFGDLLDARITSVVSAPCPGEEGAGAPSCRFAEIHLEDGPDAGQTRRIELPTGQDTTAFRADDRIVVSYYDNPEAIAAGAQYELADRDRKPVLLAMAVLFALAVVLLGRLRGLAALAGLAVTLLLLVRFVLPAILGGRSPLLVAVVGAAAIAFVALYSAHGTGPKTTVALLGTLASLGLAAALGAAFTALSQLTGRASEEATILSATGTEVDLVGIFLAGLVIGALGAIDDVTVTQASAVWELRAASPQMPRRELLRAGMRVGRDHVGSTVNTLVLAYAGSAMALLLLFSLSGTGLLQVANGEIVAVEIVRTLAGSIALIASVPITTWLAVRTIA